MISFSKYLNLINIAEQWISIPLTESEQSNEKVIYTKGSQFISSSFHSEKERNNRIWWKDYNDSNFTTFADKSLKALHDGFRKATYQKDRIGNMILMHNQVPYHYKSEIAFLVRDHHNEFKSSEWSKGFISSIRKSHDGSFDSYQIMTILNMEVMDKTRPLLSKPTPVIEIFGYKTKEEKKDESEKYLKDIKHLETKVDDLQIELLYAEENSDIKKIKKLKNTINTTQLQINSLRNKLTNLSESYIIYDKFSKRNLIVFEF